MKTLLRAFLFSLFGLWLTTYLVRGFRVSGNYQTLVIGAAALGIIYLFVKPILKLFFFPINLLSLGLLSWLINVAILYILTVLVPQISVTAWNFPGISYGGIVIPAYPLNQIATFVVAALTLSFIVNFLTWLSK